jgi:arylsulfatase A-like enzyme
VKKAFFELFKATSTISRTNPYIFFDKTKQIILEAETPYFIFAHFDYIHWPYAPEKPFKGVFLKDDTFDCKGEKITNHVFRPECKKDRMRVQKIRDRYDEQILYFDSKIGDFVEFLKINGKFDECILILVADHGQSFSKGSLYHGYGMLNEDTIHIPFIIHFPGQKEGKKVKTLAEQIDIAPTILNICGLSKPEYMQGESLLGYMNNPDKLTKKPKLSMVGGGSKLSKAAVFMDNYKLFYDFNTKKDELYNLADDPSENNNLADSGEYRDTIKSLEQIIYEVVNAKKY